MFLRPEYFSFQPEVAEALEAVRVVQRRLQREMKQRPTILVHCLIPLVFQFLFQCNLMQRINKFHLAQQLSILVYNDICQIASLN